MLNVWKSIKHGRTRIIERSLKHENLVTVLEGTVDVKTTLAIDTADSARCSLLKLRRHEEEDREQSRRLWAVANYGFATPGGR